MLIKAKKDLSFAQLVEGTGLSEAFVTAALLGQHPLPAEVAKMVGAKLELNDDDILLLQTIPVRGSIEDRVPTDPTMYRFYEMLQVYDTTLKALIHEKNSATGSSARLIFKLDVKKSQRSGRRTSCGDYFRWKVSANETFLMTINR